jgi:hypothetical protein
MRMWMAAALTCALSGCGTSAVGTGSGGSTGGAGSGSGGGSGSGSGGSTGGLPTCDITTRPQDPTDRDGGPFDPMSKICNSIVLGGAWVPQECFIAVAGGGTQDGGPVPSPAGGLLLDGDYDLFRWQRVLFSGQCDPNSTTSTTRRTFRVFNGATYIQWAGTNRTAAMMDTDYWYDSTTRTSGHTLSFVSFDCAVIPVLSYGYTADGDEFTYFAYTGGEDGSGNLETIATYRRTCRR